MHHEHVAKIQRAGADTDEQLTRAGIGGTILLDELQMIQPTRRTKPDRPHAASFARTKACSLSVIASPTLGWPLPVVIRLCRLLM